MRNNPKGIRFSDAMKVAKHYFGQPRTAGSHHVFGTGAQGRPLVNLQDGGDGKAKPYQVGQLLDAVDRVKK
jgi:hypothetical protein